ncbi:MAG: CsbD family protein [Steroidobacteraceae bacterium]
MSMNKDQVKGRAEETKGSIEEATGKVVGDKTLEAKGNIQKNLGKIRAKFGDVKKDAIDAQK